MGEKLPRQEDEQQAQLLEGWRPNEPAAPGREIAAVEVTAEALVDPSAERDHTDEHDAFPWEDAARWRPGDLDDCHMVERQLDGEALDDLFGEHHGEVI